MTPLVEALMFSGITPPEPGSRKTYCPQCNPTSPRQDRKSLSIYRGANTVSWFCHRCEWEDFAIVESVQ